MPLPPLAPLDTLSRPLSLSEYYHAAIGTSRFTLEAPREFFFVLRGDGTVSVESWQSALDGASAANPATRLRMVGARGRAAWRSDGAKPRLRLLDSCDWDACSQQGAAFLTATKLDIRHGPTVELIVAARPDGTALIVLRARHAVMDGRGAIHFLQEIFRALRGETLRGTNAGYSDFDFKRSYGTMRFPPKQPPTAWLTGGLEGNESGDVFQRLSLGPPTRDLLPRAALAMAAFAYRHSDLPVRIAIPVDLRWRVPGLLTTANFCDMMAIPIGKNDDVARVKQAMRDKTARHGTEGFPHLSDGFKRLPMPWLDLLVSRTRRNQGRRKPVETAVISNLGRLEKQSLSSPHFRLHDIAVLPLPGSVFATLTGLEDRVELMLGMPRLLASHGRFDACLAHLRAQLAA